MDLVKPNQTTSGSITNTNNKLSTIFQLSNEIPYYAPQDVVYLETSTKRQDTLHAGVDSPK
jgi:hypothetical protein